jgi:hypothetical protein
MDFVDEQHVAMLQVDHQCRHIKVVNGLSAAQRTIAADDERLALALA